MKLILGGPGCGKTTRLLQIMEQHIDDGIEPKDIAFVSFTRKAANEAAQRAMDKFDLDKRDLPNFRTIHSMAYRGLHLRRDEIMGRNDYKSIAELLGVQFKGYTDNAEGPTGGGAEGDMCLHLVNLAKAQQKELKDVWHDTGEDLDWHKLKQFSDTLLSYKHDTNKIDFSDMLDLYNAKGQSIGNKVTIIDEAQDLSRAQWGVARVALGKAKHIYIAGDDDQAIHRWNGADINHFLHLKGEQEILPISHRLPEPIHRLADKISGNIKHRYEKHWQSAKHKGRVDLDWNIEHLNLKQGTWYLLARNSFLLGAFEDLAKEQGVPYSTVKGPFANPDHADVIYAWERTRKGIEISSEDQAAIKKLTKGKPNFELPWYDGLNIMSKDRREYYRSVLRNGFKLNEPPPVYIGTIHSVKGGEADNVALITDMSWRSYQGLTLSPDDEHRVFYVGATRARKHLNIIMPQTNYGYMI